MVLGSEGNSGKGVEDPEALSGMDGRNSDPAGYLDVDVFIHRDWLWDIQYTFRL